MKDQFDHAGAPDPVEPEKHRGVFTVDRRPVPVMRSGFAELPPQRV